LVGAHDVGEVFDRKDQGDNQVQLSEGAEEHDNMDRHRLCRLQEDEKIYKRRNGNVGQSLGEILVQHAVNSVSDLG
jgi:hypothetical protein